MTSEINQLRNQIDELDKELVKLLAKRSNLVTQVQAVKIRHKLPMYAPERESVILASCRQEAEILGLSADLIENVLRQVMHHSDASK